MAPSRVLLHVCCKREDTEFRRNFGVLGWLCVHAPLHLCSPSAAAACHNTCNGELNDEQWFNQGGGGGGGDMVCCDQLFDHFRSELRAVFHL